MIIKINVNVKKELFSVNKRKNEQYVKSNHYLLSGKVCKMLLCYLKVTAYIFMVPSS